MGSICGIAFFGSFPNAKCVKKPKIFSVMNMFCYLSEVFKLNSSDFEKVIIYCKDKGENYKVVFLDNILYFFSNTSLFGMIFKNFFIFND